MTVKNDQENKKDVEAPCAEGEQEDVEASGADGELSSGGAKEAGADGELSSDNLIERVILFALDEATEHLEQSGDFAPFIMLVQGEELFIEELSAESEEDFRAAAEQTVFQMAKLCSAYVFCYDGFAELEQGQSDALITEFACIDDSNAQVIVKLYELIDGEYQFDETLYHLGETESLFADDRADEYVAGDYATAGNTSAAGGGVAAAYDDAALGNVPAAGEAVASGNASVAGEATALGDNSQFADSSVE